MRRLLFLVPVAVLALALTACGTNPPPTGPAGPQSGKAVYEANCARCHAGGGPGKGPSLDKVGAAHDKAWIADHIRDARTHKPGSTMPPFGEDKMSAANLDALAEHLAGMK